MKKERGKIWPFSYAYAIIQSRGGVCVCVCVWGGGGSLPYIGPCWRCAHVFKCPAKRKQIIRVSTFVCLILKLGQFLGSTRPSKIYGRTLTPKDVEKARAEKIVNICKEDNDHACLTNNYTKSSTLQCVKEIFIRKVCAPEYKGKIWKFVYLWIAVVDRINHKKLYPPKQSCCEKEKLLIQFIVTLYLFAFKHSSTHFGFNF